MSQLVKLKAAVQPHGILKSAVSGLTAQHSQQQQRTSAVHRQAAVAMPARRWIATAATTHAAVASPMPSVAAATASQSHSSNSSSSSSSSSSTATSFFLGLLGLVGGGVLFAQTTSTVHADSASSLPALPLIDVSSPAASSSSPSEGGSANGKASKKKGKSGRKAKRKLLEYPGKFNKLHSTADQLVNVPVNQGLRAQIPLSAFAHDPMADKSIVLIPIFELGGPNGPQAQLVVQSSLGRKHGFEAYLDVGGNSTGHYKYTTDFGMSVKPAFQMTPHGNMMSIDVDYKGREFAATGQLSSQGEATISFNQSLTNNLVGGIELNYIAMTQTNLNGGLKFTTPEKDETYAVSKKGGKYTLSYWRKLDEIAHPMSQVGYPPLTTQAGVETTYSATSGKSDVTLGMKWSRQTYNYQMALTSAAPAVQFAFDQQLIEMNPSWRWGLSGQVNYDGSGETVFGANLAFQF